MSGRWVENIFMLGSPCYSRDHKTNETENTLENGREKWAWQEQKGDKRGYWAGSWSDWIWYVYKIIYYLILSCQTIDLIKNKLGRVREKSATSWMLCWYLYLYISPLQMMVTKSRWIYQSHPSPKVQTQILFSIYKHWDTYKLISLGYWRQEFNLQSSLVTSGLVRRRSMLQGGCLYSVPYHWGASRGNKIESWWSELPSPAMCF